MLTFLPFSLILYRYQQPCRDTPSVPSFSLQSRRPHVGLFPLDKMSSLTHLVSPSQPASGIAQKSHRLLTPTTNPIPLLSSSLAQRHSLVHTLLVPLYYYLRGPRLIADPLTTLVQDLAVVAASQCAFCAVCLPQAGAWVSGTSGGPILEGTSSLAGRAKGKGAVIGTGSLRRKNVPAGSGGSFKGAGEGSWRARIMVSLYSLCFNKRKVEDSADEAVLPSQLSSR